MSDNTDHACCWHNEYPPTTSSNVISSVCCWCSKRQNLMAEVGLRSHGPHAPATPFNVTIDRRSFTGTGFIGTGYTGY